MKKFLLVIAVFAFSGCINRINKTDDAFFGFGGDTPWELKATPEEILKASIDDNKSPISEEKFDRLGAKTVKIGLLLPLTGKASELGHSMHDAVMLSLWDQYSALSPSDAKSVKVVVIPSDTKGTWDGTEEAMKEVLAKDVDIILGPLYSNSVKAATPFAKAEGIKMITFSNNKGVAGDGVFVMGFQPEEQIERVVEYAKEQGKKKFASFTPDNKYGEIVRETLRAKVEELKTQENQQPIQNVSANLSFEDRIRLLTKQAVLLERQITYPANRARYARPLRELLDFDEKEFTEQEKLQAELLKKELMEQQELLKISQEEEQSEEIVNNEAMLEELMEITNEEKVPFDALLIPEGGKELLDISSLLEYYHFDKKKIQLLGSGQWDDSDILNVKVLQNGWFANSPPNRKKKFYEHFYNNFNYYPQRLSSLAYDAMALTVVLSFNSDFSMETLTSPAGFNAPVDGLFRFNKYGIAERKLAIVEVTPEGFKVIDKAPEAFEIEPVFHDEPDFEESVRRMN